jgi:hypothetical protein
MGLATSFLRYIVPIAGIPFAASFAVAGGTGSDPVAAESELRAEAPYLAENNVAMTKMMTAMTARPTGDVDRDFVAMMVPHHQGAIDMAVAVLRYGSNAQLKRLAQEIVVTQQEEIVAMRHAVGEQLGPSTASPTQLSAPPGPATPTGMIMK